MAREFHVVAGKYEDFDGEQIENIKFCDCTETLEAAEKLISDNKLYTYPICRIEVYGFQP